ncbi:type II methionyl aminopeptidase [Candidatus Bathyarchaeota archaeon ex4484_40]|nr:MAG: type II methionyl aminopeptidase [Candidatus Bathyarchaeota archaeon ex4484_40]
MVTLLQEVVKLSDWVENLRRAGAISRKVKEEAYRIVREGASVLEVCERLEAIILEEDAKPAFPCNISINEVAAHYSPLPGDSTVIPPSSVVKVDIGVSVDGYIADTAISVAVDPMFEPMVEAAKAALREAIRLARPGVSVSRIGAAVQRVVEQMGFKPIRNLTGHEIARYSLHAGLSIPSVASHQSGRLEAWHIYAIEPFVTTPRGGGEVVPRRLTTIFRVDSGRILQMRLKKEEKMLAKLLAERFDSLPYSPRWIPSYEKIKRLHERMVKLGRIHRYPVLVEKKGEPVAQAEHTILVTEDGCEVIT